MKIFSFKHRAEREFGIVMLVAFSLLSWVLADNYTFRTIFGAIACLLFGLLLFAPTYLFIPSQLWLRLANQLRYFMEPLIILAVYFVCVVPTSFFVVLFQLDYMKQKKRKKNSYWIIKDNEPVNFEESF